MDKIDFCRHVRELAMASDIGLELDNLLYANISTEGFIGNLISGYGELILETVTSGDVSDEEYEQFWDYIFYRDNRDDEMLDTLYKNLNKDEDEGGQ